MVTTQTFDGAPRGSILAVPPHEIPDDGARYIQDGRIDRPGIISRRGSLRKKVGWATLSDAASGLVHALRPDGHHRVGVLHGPSAAKLAVYSDDYTSYTDIDWDGILPTSPYYYVDTKPAVGNAGTLIGTSRSLNAISPAQALGLWKGADMVEYSTGTISLSRGAKTVTGTGTTWLTNVSPGMFLFAVALDPADTTVYCGCVESVDSNTQITLEENSPFSVIGGTYTLKPVRGICPRYAGGRVTTDGTTLLQGSNTKWIDNGVDSGTWCIYRKSDMGFIGKVSTVDSNSQITLTDVAALTVEIEEYVAIKADGNYDLDTTADPRKVGFLTETYAERQWYLNNAGTPEGTYTLRYSEPNAPEDIDLDPNAGSYIPIVSSSGGAHTQGAALASAFNSLLILKENEAFALQGQTESQFTLHKLYDDGTLSPMSVQKWQGGVLWAGRDGIYAYDGVQVSNIVQDSLGDYYKSCVRDFDPTTHRMWSMIVRDHYKLFIEDVSPSYSPRKGSETVDVSRTTISIYLPNMAVTFDTNLDIRGAITMPAETSLGTLFVVNETGGGRVCSATDLFEVDAADELTCVSNSVGPDFYFESKRYSLGDTLRKKLFKSLLLHYWAAGDNLKLDTIAGLNEVGRTSVTQWLKTLINWNTCGVTYGTWDSLASFVATWDDLGGPVFNVKRIKFVKRSQLFGFRIYQASSNVTKAQLGPWALGYKMLRPGRV